MFVFKSESVSWRRALFFCAPLVLSGCGSSEPEKIEASAYTQEANDAVLDFLPFDSDEDIKQAEKGLVARDERAQVLDANGKVLWSASEYAFVKGDAPDTVNPSLWRQAKLNGMHGLFEVTPGIYQMRGYDIANMTLIKGDKGWIVVDPLTAYESAKVALEFAAKHLGDINVTGLILTHSHADHFGGSLAAYNPDTQPAIPVIAPEHFMEESTTENILAGATMLRRATYMYGRTLERSQYGKVDSGLGKAVVFGKAGIVEPSVTITHTGQKLTVDGVDFEFQYTPNSEAPAELTFYLPQHKAFCGAEVVSRQMHNLYTLRGTKVRDGLGWSNYIEEARKLFVERSEVYFGSHNWPIWGSENIDKFLRGQRDMYKYIHDQTLRLSYAGLTPNEIAETIELPESIAKTFSNRGYYGTLSHNSKAVYQAYFGWYDGNPANLNPLTPVAAAEKYIEAMGGKDEVLELGEEAVENGEYRWAAELLNHLVFAGGDDDAKKLLAEAYTQMAYQAESAPWRDSYLSAAQDLLHGKPEQGNKLDMMADMLKHTPVESFFDAMAAQLNGPEAEGENFSFRVELSDKGQSYVLWIENAVLHHAVDDGSIETDTQIRLTHELFMKVMLGQASLMELVGSDELEIDGSSLDLLKFLSLLDKQSEPFNIVEP